VQFPILIGTTLPGQRLRYFRHEKLGWCGTYGIRFAVNRSRWFSESPFSTLDAVFTPTPPIRRD